jgi:hypothetical protein
MKEKETKYEDFERNFHFKKFGLINLKFSSESLEMDFSLVEILTNEICSLMNHERIILWNPSFPLQ